jgi:S1-C subfamily serine protease
MIAVAGGGLATSLKTATAVTPPTTVDHVLATPSLAGVVEAVSPAVVSIEVMHKARPAFTAQHGQRPGVPEHFKRFFGEDFAERFGFTPDFGPGSLMPSGGIGSGFIVDADGYVVTSNHVIDNAETVTVILDDGSRLDAEIVGQDTRTDLALLRVESDEPLPTVPFAADDSTRVGDWVVAVGNPFGVGKTATFGIVSARGRGTGPNPYLDHLQIDAPINRGNSGGPAVNLHGEVIGVNTSIVSPTGGNVGIGFAIPAATARLVVDERRVVPTRVARRRFDQDDVRSHVPEQLPGQRDRFTRKFDDAQSGQCAHITPSSCSAATWSAWKPRSRVSTSTVCSPKHGPPRSKRQSVSEKCTGWPSTRTSPILAWRTVGQRPKSAVLGSMSIRSCGFITADTGTPAPRSISWTSNFSCRAVHAVMFASSGSWLANRCAMSWTRGAGIDGAGGRFAAFRTGTGGIRLPERRRMRDTDCTRDS